LGEGRAGEIEGFLKKVREKFEPHKIVLFGSRGRGDEFKQSDYDIIVVSPRFEGVPFLKRLEMLFELWDYDFNLDILAYTPEEFEAKSQELGIVAQAVREGIEI